MNHTKDSKLKNKPLNDAELEQISGGLLPFGPGGPPPPPPPTLNNRDSGYGNVGSNNKSYQIYKKSTVNIDISIIIDIVWKHPLIFLFGHFRQFYKNQ